MAPLASELAVWARACARAQHETRTQWPQLNLLGQTHQHDERQGEPAVVHYLKELVGGDVWLSRQRLSCKLQTANRKSRELSLNRCASVFNERRQVLLALIKNQNDR